jgi:hypothetical protein
MHLYLKTSGGLEEAARRVGASALPGFQSQLREGLNLGGGEYFKFSLGVEEVFFVCNDEDHPDVYVERRLEYPYYCYVLKRDYNILERMKDALTSQKIECLLEDEDQA